MGDPKPLEELLPPNGGWDAHVVAFNEVVRRLRKLAERHNPEPGKYFCGCGRSWPCPDAEILEGGR